ncbi:MAG: NUDIX domain-containing protein [Corynebacterium sp.]|uniref:NUDIX hydrolase n=1 Tax=Corynebacterium sp. TaxID=1720 RepID=UPI0026DCB0BA|nr:NUDIX domain-containing protein [Corynebacterium sp.]MDO5029386.1 NUDIX domain-containing protein [Corynebacterium sp.]
MTTHTPPVEPRLAATVLLLRDGDRGLEVYVQERVSSMRFAPNMTVFPGGGVDRRDFPAENTPGLAAASRIAAAFDVDRARAHALTCAAVRETFEESGTLLVRDAKGDIVSDGHRFHRQRRQLEAHELSLTEFLSNEKLALDEQLVSPWANWVTPESNPIRYDTYFFLAALPEGQDPDGDTTEASSVGWFRPATILDGWRRDLLGLMPPTWAQLMRLDGVSTVAEALTMADETPVRRTSSDFFEDPFMDEYFAVATHMGHLRKNVKDH